jgi:hypothetical protein
MPNLTHEAPLELIKQHPALAVDLFRAMTEGRYPRVLTSGSARTT